MQPPATAAAAEILSSARSESGIGKVQALDQDADEGAVEVVAAGVGGLRELRGGHRDDARVGHDGHVGAALRAEDGSIHAGANVENAAYPQGQCAEASAITSASIPPVSQ